jgi:ATP-dependent helicase/nuclease subunit A
MTDTIIAQVLDVFELNDRQRSAALQRGKDVVVTAGAGSGKTSALVARYACLLAEGVSPRRIAAITFTKKAAMQMRSRVRNKIMELQHKTQGQAEGQKWVELSAQMDSARIGTIHSLCTEILRSHPAEAGVDPRFEVLDEGLSKALRVQVVEDTLNQLVEEDRFLPLLAGIPVRNLTKMLKQMLEKRLEVQETFAMALDNRARLDMELKERMNSPLTGGLIRELRGFSPQDLQQDAGDKLFAMVQELLRCWSQAENALAENDPAKCALHLYEARRSYLNRKSGRSDSSVKQIIAELQENFDKIINPLTGGREAKDPQPSVESEALFENLLPLLDEAFNQVHQAYKDQVQKRQALDFDDLEFHAQQLLTREDIRQHWQQELDALLVDEYQDTNQRQRDIVNALAGKGGGLFIVGDMRQSIYRFRRADVTVFREEQERIKGEGGIRIDLDRTYRAHEPLLNATGDLLASVIGTDEDPVRQYYVPYTPLVADQKNPPEDIQPPHVEFVFGAGEETESARPLAARALVERLLQLKAEGQIKKWDEVALLFRASTGYSFYEEALEDVGIPFVTVAGRGFYERPEIRDLVNILRTLADPLDDLSFAGLLRSPAFGLSDVALYQLRQAGLPYWSALQADLSALQEEDQVRARHTLNILTALLPLVDRIPVAELLKQVVDAVDYRAILAAADVKTEDKKASQAGGRLWRNLDKLLEDAQLSQDVTVRDFLDKLSTLNDAGAREGEAPAEAEGSVTLMTIHKAKGLEYPVVVLADSGRQLRSQSELVYFSNDLGVSFKLEPAPMLYNLAKIVDSDQEDCEALRLLYVALTRAQTKLLISGHATFNAKGKIRLNGWAQELDAVAGMPSQEFLTQEGEPFEVKTGSQQALRVWCLLEGLSAPTTLTATTGQEIPIKSSLRPLYAPLEGFGQTEPEEEMERLEEIHSWRATQPDERLPGTVLGKIVHKALQRWLFPGDPRLSALLETETFNAGLASEKLRRDAVDRATGLLARFRQHPAWEEIISAQERFTELPYTYSVKGRLEHRVIDMLYRNTDGWQILDFKTDPILTPSHKAELVRKYAPQVQRYAATAASKLGQPVQGSICFLDDQGKVELVEV